MLCRGRGPRGREKELCGRVRGGDDGEVGLMRGAYM